MQMETIYAKGMKLTLHTDYALRVMIHLAARGGDLTSIGQVARLYGVSQNHLMKVVQSLGQGGFIETIRGRHGGIRLARPADEIKLGALIRHTEGCNPLIECQGCLIAPACDLQGILAEAMQAFMQVLDRYNLADLIVRKQDLRFLFGLDNEAPLLGQIRPAN